MASFVLAAPDAHAGSYGTPTYTGGQYIFTPAPGGYTATPSANYTSGGDGVSGYGNGGSNGAGTAACSGQIKTIFPYTPAPGLTTTSDPPPQVIVTETCTASVGASSQGYNTAPAISGSCDNGLGLSQSSLPAYNSDTPPYYNLSVYADDATTRYEVKPGASPFVLTCSPSAQASYNGSSSLDVSYSASVSPVTIIPVGAKSDGNGGWAILIGQYCTPELDGIPDALLNNAAHPPVYQWSVSGTTLQSWTVSGDQKTTTEVDGPGLLNIEYPNWYWNDLKEKVETITCTVMLTPPNGQGSPFTVTASQDVRVYVPNWTATGTGGYVKVNIFVSGNNYSQYEIYAGATVPMEQANANNLNGMNFNATLVSPAPALFADGNLKLVQLVTPREAATNYNGFGTDTRFFPDYGEEGLDSVYPYGWSKASGPPAPIVFYTGDSPGFDLVDHITYSATLKHDFKDFLLYLAPGSQQPVPVARFIWSDDGNAQIPSTGLWSDYAQEHSGSDSVGTVTPSGNDASFLPDNVFPSWTQID